MSTCKDFVESLADKLPDLITPKEMVTCGIYRSEQAAYIARRRGVGPGFIRIPSRGIVYPKNGVLAFLRSKIVEAPNPKKRGPKPKIGLHTPTPMPIIRN